ncbi:MAG: hypothetical protein V4689_13125 [Verrucomicrobiota bacterium]
MTALLFSCENATCAVPEAYREIFRGSEDVLTSTRGWEPGSLNLAQGFAMKFRTPLVHGDVTRLLMDFEQDGDDRWSEFSLKLPEATRVKVVDRHERPYRLSLNQRITEDLRRHEMLLHVMVHTDSTSDGLVMLETPAGGLLAEKFARAWRAHLAAAEVDVRHVSGSGVTPLGASLTGAFPANQYAQIRLSVSQTFFLEGRPWRWETLKKLLLESLSRVTAEVTAVSAPEGSSTDRR